MKRRYTVSDDEEASEMPSPIELTPSPYLLSSRSSRRGELLMSDLSLDRDHHTSVNNVGLIFRAGDERMDRRVRHYSKGACQADRSIRPYRFLIDFSTGYPTYTI